MPTFKSLSIFWLRWERIILFAFLAVLFWRLSVASLPSSLWIDETGTVWVSSGSLTEVLAKINEPEFPQPPLYALLIWAWRQIAGSSEFSLRFPSLLAHLLTCWLLARLSHKLFPNFRNSDLYTLLIFYSHTLATFSASDARPYALTLLFLVWAMTERLASLSSPAWGPILRYGLAAACVVHGSVFFSLFLVFDFCFLVFMQWRGVIPFSWRYFVSPLIAVVLVIPLVPFLIQVQKTKALHIVLTTLPTWTDLAAQWAIPRVIIAACLASLLYLLWQHPGSSFPEPKRTASPLFLGLACVWAFPSTLAIFVLSSRPGDSIFLTRYLLSSLPALALLGGHFSVALSSNAPFWRACFASLLFLLNVSGGGFQLWRPHTVEHWRQAAALVSNWSQANPNAPFVASATFVESIHLPVPYTPKRIAFLYAYLSAYSWPKPSAYMPLGVTPENEAYIRDIVDQAAEKPRFIFVSFAIANTTAWMDAYLGSRFKRTLLQDSEPRVAVYERLQGPTR